MGIKYSFVDSVVYGTEDVNDITRCITGAGIAPFLTKDSYAVSDLNALTEALVEAGTSLDGCKCVAYNAGTAEMSINIAQGIIFFDSGVRLELDADGYSIKVEPNTPGYVFANYSPALQKADIVFAAELPQDGETVVLAKVLQNGLVRDMRSFARSKVATVGANACVKLPFERLSEPVLYNEGRYITAKASGIDLSRFNYAVLVATRYYGDVFEYFPSPGYRTVFFDIGTQSTCFVLYDGELPAGSSNFIHSVNSDYVYYLEIIDGELCIVCHCEEKDKARAIYYTLGCTVCLI